MGKVDRHRETVVVDEMFPYQGLSFVFINMDFE